MLHTAAVLLQCPFYRPNLCIASACMSWVVTLPDIETWQAFHSGSDPALLPTIGTGVTGTATKPGDGGPKLWEYRYSHINQGTGYDHWDHQPTAAAEGYC